ncbi:MAG TPA: mannose-1-phosphate guanyltransferase [Candidatus Latescibacteria bacterium]|nr:mannose-1-phosphate guanyltransferase [Gemmatimonadota bacterium]HCR18250.1 mannose-1-phosphate guanyltransferase [Candidatus Latescibacterota bacterium]
MKFVIRAGGVGTRLWPFSRINRPKQFHPMVGDRSMLQVAVDRIRQIAGPDDLHVSTGSGFVSLVKEQLPELGDDRIIVEPALRNTGPAVGLECILLGTRYPGCTIASLGSDHHIGRPEEFCRLLQVAESVLKAHPEFLFTIGVKPTRPETGYGYIEKGEVVSTVNGEPVYKVEAFQEKPDAGVAKSYVDSGNHLWNSNMFVWKAQTMLDIIEDLVPEIHGRLMRIRDSVGSLEERSAIEQEYPQMPEVAIDNAVIEKAENVAALEADIGWSDIGSWTALHDVLQTDEDGNLFSGEVLGIQTRDVTAYGPDGKLIALVDVEDLVIVDTPDALLVCPRGSAQRVREVVEALRGSKKQGLYI